MLYVLIVFVLLCLIGIKINNNGNKDYLCTNQTTAIKGIFAIVIFFSHFSTYIILDNNVISNRIFIYFLQLIGQLMVAIFLFYSGYGICISSIKKESYLNKFPKKRILKTLVSFDFAIILFLIVNIILKKEYSAKDILLAFIGWTSIGNSNWFVFSILVMYVVTYISGRLNKNQIDIKTDILITIFSMIFIVVMYYFKERYWYDTVLCYSLGLWVGLYKEKIDNILNKKHTGITLGFIIIFILLYTLRENIIIYELLSMMFCLLLVLVTYKIKIQNEILIFLGKYSFEIYILQRIPFSIFQGYLKNNPIVFFVITLICTIFLSLIFKKINEILNKKILKIKE